MANEAHLAQLKQGVEAWNQWRSAHPKIQPDLRGADLPRANLRWADLTAARLTEVDLSRADLAAVDLTGAYLTYADLRLARLSGANLSEARLGHANLLGAHLAKARLHQADLVGADLRGTDLNWTALTGARLHEADLSGAHVHEADLRGADLTQADLAGADLRQADLRGADLAMATLAEARLHQVDLSGAHLSEARMRGTIFGDVDLSMVRGLETVHHWGPSTIGIDTLYRSQGNIPEVFLRGAGVPDEMITYIKSLVGRPFDFYSCFISYSSKDQEFAERLYADLQNKGVRCWFAPEDLKIGEKFRTSIDEAIRLRDKLLLVLSTHSMTSEWVETEVETAFEEEHRRKKTILFPIRLDDSVMETHQAWATSIRRTRHIGDFHQWKDHDTYQQAFQRLLRDLKANI